MSDTTDKSEIRFYFSFRSPYAWLAAERLESELGALGVPIKRVKVLSQGGALASGIDTARGGAQNCEHRRSL